MVRGCIAVSTYLNVSLQMQHQAKVNGEGGAENISWDDADKAVVGRVYLQVLRLLANYTDKAAVLCCQRAATCRKSGTIRTDFLEHE